MCSGFPWVFVKVASGEGFLLFVSVFLCPLLPSSLMKHVCDFLLYGRVLIPSQLFMVCFSFLARQESAAVHLAFRSAVIFPFGEKMDSSGSGSSPLIDVETGSAAVEDGKEETDVGSAVAAADRSGVESNFLNSVAPDEVLLHIFRFCEPSDVVRGISKVCQRWRAIVASLLPHIRAYHAFRLTRFGTKPLSKSHYLAILAGDDDLTDASLRFSRRFGLHERFDGTEWHFAWNTGLYKVLAARVDARQRGCSLNIGAISPCNLSYTFAWFLQYVATAFAHLNSRFRRIIQHRLYEGLFDELMNSLPELLLVGPLPNRPDVVIAVYICARAVHLRDVVEVLFLLTAPYDALDWGVAEVLYCTAAAFLQLSRKMIIPSFHHGLLGLALYLYDRNHARVEKDWKGRTSVYHSNQPFSFLSDHHSPFFCPPWPYPAESGPPMWYLMRWPVPDLERELQVHGWEGPVPRGARGSGWVPCDSMCFHCRYPSCGRFPCCPNCWQPIDRSVMDLYDW